MMERLTHHHETGVAMGILSLLRRDRADEKTTRQAVEEAQKPPRSGEAGADPAAEDGGAARGPCAARSLLGAHAGRRVSAEAAARSAAAALAWVSRCSMVASESATTPPPACTCAVPSLITAVRIAIAMSMSPAKSK